MTTICHKKPECAACCHCKSEENWHLELIGNRPCEKVLKYGWVAECGRFKAKEKTDGKDSRHT